MSTTALTRSIATVILLAVFPGFAHAQNSHSYHAPATPVNWISDNPFHLFLVRGGDTVTAPLRMIAVLRESWHPTGDGFNLIRTSVDVGLGHLNRTDTLTVTRRGRVLRVNGKIDYNEGEWDALLRLPSVPLRPGLEWSDTLSHSTRGIAADGLYEVRRQYKVTRTDSTGFVVDIKGEVLFNTSMWTDSAAGQYRWFQLRGPVEEQFVFDSAVGQLHRRSWLTRLEGIGGDHNGASTDTVPAGLHSRDSRYRIPDARAAALMAALPGADTSVSLTGDGSVLFAHTLGREAGRLFEGFRRADGLNGRAEVTLAANVPVRWSYSWVGPDTDERTLKLARDGRMLVRDGNRIDPPAAEWGVAEHAMLGTLVPSLAALPTAQTPAFAIYRPTPGEWDVVQVTRRSLRNATLFVLTRSGGGTSALLVDANGLLLYEEVTNADGSRLVRVPVAPSRQLQVEQMLTALRGGG